ncbi:H-NS histone family protein [Aquabacterium soli]|jgi:DNA-binding protein H-NS|uniref:H-NS histone family protein n=1 Tax=Aquabacterium soli TaxID=2493092 RepID=A0A426V9G6_9BURK|nr:H-NS histone family protein [Aquabacterium soli]RRS03523.1 H-NS histone family protein [Aquabacterium soli]
MTTYKELLAQKAALDKQASELDRQLQDARKAERAGVIDHIKQLLSANGLTVADLGLKSGVATRSNAAAGSKVAPKYRNVDTGETWSGRGLQPKWIKAALAAGKTLDQLKVG